MKYSYENFEEIMKTSDNKYTLCVIINVDCESTFLLRWLQIVYT